MRLLERRFMTSKSSPPVSRSASRDEALAGNITPIDTAVDVAEEDTTLESSSPVLSSEAIAEDVSKRPPTDQDGKGDDKLTQRAAKPRYRRLRRQLNAVDSLDAIKLKMFLFVVAYMAATFVSIVQAGMFTFYFPNMLRPKAYSELSDMIKSLESQINYTRDQFSDIEYFWGTLKLLDEHRDQEESVCSKILPKFRELAIQYIYVDYEHYIQPTILYQKYLIGFRDEWYPQGKDSKYLR
jgi:hypothetical protein